MCFPRPDKVNQVNWNSCILKAIIISISIILFNFPPVKLVLAAPYHFLFCHNKQCWQRTSKHTAWNWTKPWLKSEMKIWKIEIARKNVLIFFFFSLTVCHGETRNEWRVTCLSLCCHCFLFLRGASNIPKVNTSFIYLLVFRSDRSIYY